jgi:hypothetical protein
VPEQYFQFYGFKSLVHSSLIFNNQLSSLYTMLILTECLCFSVLFDFCLQNDDHTNLLGRDGNLGTRLTRLDTGIIFYLWVTYIYRFM